MKKIFFSLIFIFAILSGIAEEAFYIKNYDVKITISEQGYFDVKETIAVFFKEKRRGIIRQIPFRYSYDVSPYANQAKRKGYKYGYYDIVLEDINVKNQEFVVLDESPYKNIRIGSADKYISGDRTYEISYRVWGALNKFTDSTEWVWNIIGNEWDCIIENVSYQVVFPKPYSFGAGDILVFKGSKGSTETITPQKITNRSVFGFTTDALKNYEGLTVALRFKNYYFSSVIPPLDKVARSYYINKHHISLLMNADGSVNVTEDFDLQYKNSEYCFYKFLPKPYGLYGLYATDIHVKSSKPLTYIYYKSSNNNYIKVFSSSRQLEGNEKFQLTYKVFGCFDITNDTAYTYYPLLLTGEPVKNASFSITFPPNWDIKEENIKILKGYNPAVDVVYNNKNNVITGAQQNQINNASCTLYLLTKAKYLDLRNTPANVYATDFFIKNMYNSITVEPDGDVKFYYKVDVSFLDSTATGIFKPEIYSRFYRNRSFYSYLKNYPDVKVPFPPLFGDVYKPIIKEISSPNENFNFYYYYVPAQIQWNNGYVYEPQKTYEYQYSMYNILKSEKDYYVFNFPVFMDCTEPVEKGVFEFFLPNTEQDKIYEFTGYVIDKDKKRRNIPLIVSGNKITGELDLLKPGDVPMLEIHFSKDYLSVPITKKIGFFFRNNKGLAWVFTFFMVLFILWFLFGRDKKRPVVVQYYPPVDLSSAEAGYIWDNKLHKRDLISLIYQWAGQGLIEINNIDGKDYELKKLNALPANAKPFEKTMFDGLFKKGSSTKVSALRNVFYVTLQNAHNQMKKHSKQNRFFTPGTLGFKVFLKVIGWIFGFIACISFFVHLGYGDMLWPLSLAAITVMLFVFARIMPQRAPFGAEKFAQLQGFYEFLKRAEMLRLEALLKENPKYFEQTLAYATVMGLSDHWAEKFKTLLTEPPSFYKGYKGDFNTALFMRQLRSSMHKMESDMTYKYTPSSSYSGSGGSFKSSFSFKSSSGGGFSSFGGGGYSGGGFGGGGGKSW